jgi:hypothetical protein
MAERTVCWGESEVIEMEGGGKEGRDTAGGDVIYGIHVHVLCLVVIGDSIVVSFVDSFLASSTPV